MTGGNNIINLGDLAKPAEVLINRVSDAIGGIAKPWQIGRVAKAEAKAEIIRANARVEISEIEQRAILRMVREEGKKQQNIEAITMQSLQHLDKDADPEKISEDWLTQFFERSRSYSDAETQAIWARVLAGEANSTGSFSRRTLDVLSSLDKGDANAFTKLCSFLWNKDIGPFLAVPSVESDVLKSTGLAFSDLANLDNAGLIHFETLANYVRQGFDTHAILTYFDRGVVLKFPHPPQPPYGNRLSAGPALLTRAGSELCKIVDAQGSEPYVAHMLLEWGQAGIQMVSAASLVREQAAREEGQQRPAEA